MDGRIDQYFVGNKYFLKDETETTLKSLMKMNILIMFIFAKTDLSAISGTI